MGQRCDHCINKTQCTECDSSWKDKFIPSDEVKKYFKSYYNGVRGVDGRSYHFDNLNEELKSTHVIWVGSTPYCPYCGNKMYHIQADLGDKLPTIGYACICEGARSELEYEKSLKLCKKNIK